MSDELHKYQGNLKHHKVEAPAKTYPPVSATSEELYMDLRPSWLANSHDRDIGEYWIDELQEARSKDTLLIQQLVKDMARLQAQYAKDTGRETSIGNEALKAAIAQGFKL